MPNWDGDERRKSGGEFCGQHIATVSSLVRIETSVMNIEKGIVSAATFKQGIIISLVGMTLLFVAQIATFAFLYGQLVRQVEVNTIRLNILENLEKK